MTGDDRIRPAVEKAVEFSLRAQHPATGGWRYRPAVDVGDTSQLGWQMMALASAQRAGMDVPTHTWVRVGRFLRSVRRGQYGGLASYRPDGPPSTSMTAEAFYCRVLLQDISGEPIDQQAVDEATKTLLASLPGRSHQPLLLVLRLVGVAPTAADERRSGCGLGRVERRVERGVGQYAANAGRRCR